MQTARIFNNGNSQAVRLPKEFRFDEDDLKATPVTNNTSEFHRVPDFTLEDWSTPS